MGVHLPTPVDTSGFPIQKRAITGGKPIKGEVSMETRQTNNQKSAANNRQREKGFTILEVLMAVSILTVAILTVASMQISSIRGNAFAGKVTEATTLAGRQLEILQSLPYNDTELTAGTTHSDTNPPANYTVAWTVTDEAIFNNTKTIDVTVAWTDHGVQRNVSMQQVRGK